MTILQKSIIVAPLLLATIAANAQISFENSSGEVIEVKPPSSTGLTAVYVLPDASSVKIIYQGSGNDASRHVWQKFDSRGGGYAEPVASTIDGNRSIVTLQGGDSGYIVTPSEGAAQICVWIVDYAGHECVLRQLFSPQEQDCGQQRLALDGEAGRITYYSVNGRGETLSRELKLAYGTLSLDEERRQWVNAEAEETLDYVSGDIICQAPLRDTDFMLTGDRFQRQWGREQSVATATVAAHSVEAAAWADQTVRDKDNEIKDGDQGTGDTLGGSAPVEISFTAAVTDAAVYREWQFATDPQFDIIDMRVNELDVERTFEDYGTVYARFVCGNNDGTCEYVSQTYAINIGESRLECPNAFSPGASEGVNDLWKVSYKSITKFECHIFNRWGKELFSSTDPAVGWNGKI
ncbi:MAG: gliding motility-associated C-terminal domain-containing protein, partial [Muribaculaceae bacterium]|nr:gliding motility-associated C-terminal domain-containing protein [Muribaculaceae bacterium]